MSDPHTLLVEAEAQVNGLMHIAGAGRDMVDFDQLTGYELVMLLEPIAKRIAKAKKLLEQ